jgi:hypothetical protein
MDKVLWEGLQRVVDNYQFAQKASVPTMISTTKYPDGKLGAAGNGVHERIRTSDPRIHTTSTFAAAFAFVVWTVPSPWTLRPLGAAHPVSTPSPDFSGAWLGIGTLEDQ